MKKKPIAILSVFVALFITTGIALNPTLEVTNFTFVSEKLPPSFEGYKIAVIADTQSLDYGSPEPEAEKKLREIKPDLIALVGDIYDINIDTNTKKNGLVFIENISDIAPCVYVNGNHEAFFSLEEKGFISAEFARLGVTVLEKGSYQIAREGGSIEINGLSDPRERQGEAIDEYIGGMRAQGGGRLQILLFHRADLLDKFSGSGFDMIISGHTHGGHIRLPFVGGIMSPDHVTWFPKYSGGHYRLDDGTDVYVSRGIGNTKDIPRIFNRPEIVVITLKGTPRQGK